MVQEYSKVNNQVNYDEYYRKVTRTRLHNRHSHNEHHMAIPWDELEAGSDSVPAVQAPFKKKAILASRVGLMQLSGGAGAWRVRDSINIICKALGITCTVDIGLITLNCTFYSADPALCGSDDGVCDSFTQSLTLKTTGINTDRLMMLSNFLHNFPYVADKHSIVWFNQVLDSIQSEKAHYSCLDLGFASGFACFAFTFLLGGGLPEMICALLGAFVGNLIKTKMVRERLSFFMSVMVSVAMACATYIAAMKFGEYAFHVKDVHEAGYICAMLFIIPGFPLITGGTDIAKVEMRSGLERLSYAFMIITISTLIGWVTADILDFQPGDFIPLGLSVPVLLILRLIMSFIGVYGFSLMYNSPKRMAATAGIIGMIANTTRLFLAPYTTGFFAALVGAAISGLLAAAVHRKAGYPRVSLSIPAIVIMVPGMYLYRGIFNIGINNFAEAAKWLTNGMLIILALPLGIVISRFISDWNFRVCS